MCSREGLFDAAELWSRGAVMSGVAQETGCVCVCVFWGWGLTLWSHLKATLKHYMVLWWLRNCNVIPGSKGRHVHTGILHIKIKTLPKKKSILIFSWVHAWISVCMSVSKLPVSGETSSWGEGVRETDTKKTTQSWALLPPGGNRGNASKRRSYCSRGAADWRVWGFLLIAPPLPPEGWLWSLHTFKFQRGNI